MATYKRPTLIDNIQRILFLPCSNPVSAYVELAADAIFRFGVTVAEPDPKEVYHHVVGEPLVHTIRNKVHEIGGELKQTPSFARRYLGKLIGRIDRLVWWNFLFLAADDALYDSTSLFIAMTPCESGKGLGSGVPWISAIPTNGTWQSADFQFPEGSPFFPAHPSQVGISAQTGHEGTVAVSTKWVNSFNEAVGVETRIVYIPFDGSPNIVLDYFNNNDQPGVPKKEWSHAWYKYSPGSKSDGVLRAEFRYSGIPQPFNEVFLSADGSCFLSGLP